MTIALVEILQDEPRPYFYTALVETVRADGLLDLVIGVPGDPDPNIVRYRGASYLESYVPQVYDKVVFMTHQTRKTLVFGKAFDGSTNSLARTDVPLDLVTGWELVRGRAVRRSGVVVLNAELRSPDGIGSSVVGTITSPRHRPQGVPAALSWVVGEQSGAGAVDDETGQIVLRGQVPERSLILISAVWDSLGARNGQ